MIPKRNDLVELSSRFSAIMSKEDGEERIHIVGTPDRQALKVMTQELKKYGRAVMLPFVEWCVRSHGLSVTNAQTIASTVWLALWETECDPVSILRDPEITLNRHRKLWGALRTFGHWLYTSGQVSATDRELGRRIINELAGLPKQGNKIITTVKHPWYRACVDGFTQDEVVLILEGVERLHSRYKTRWPWLRSILYAITVLGVRPHDIVYVKRTDTIRAWNAHNAGNVTGIPVWRKNLKSLTIPVKLIENEVKLWVNWPYEWGVLADIISPLGEAKTHCAHARAKIKKAMDMVSQDVFHRNWEKSDWKKLRLATIQRLYTACKGDLLTMSQILGISIPVLRQYDYNAVCLKA